MELTPQALRVVEFREKMRGYHPDDVDEFVERAFATADALAERLRQAEDRLRQVEQKAAAGGDSDESLRRTLILAQRTADAAIAEAQEQAASTIADAERRSNATIASAEDQARRTAVEAQEQLRRDVEQLSIARAELQTDVDSLRRYLEDERNNHRTTLSSALRAFEDGLTLNVPTAHDAAIPPAPGDTRESYYGRYQSASDVVSTASLPIDEVQPHTGAPASVDEVVDLDGDNVGENTMAIDADDDPYFAELRRAVNDNEPLGPRDDDALTAEGEHTNSGSGQSDDLFGDDRRFLRRRR